MFTHPVVLLKSRSLWWVPNNSGLYSQRALGTCNFSNVCACSLICLHSLWLCKPAWLSGSEKREREREQAAYCASHCIFSRVRVYLDIGTRLSRKYLLIFTAVLQYIKTRAGKYLPHVIRAHKPQGIWRGERSRLMPSLEGGVLYITKWSHVQESPTEQCRTL